MDQIPNDHSASGFARRTLSLPFPLRELKLAERRTYIFDSIRGAVDGVLINLDQAVYLLVAIQFFSVPDLYISLIASSKFIGLLGTLFLTLLLGGRGWKKSQLVASASILSGVLLAMAGILPNEGFFVAGIVLHLIFIALRVPLLTAIYEENYAQSRRGRLYSTSVLLSIVSGLATSFLAGRLLDTDIELYRPLFLIVGLVSVLSGLLFFFVPSTEIRRERGSHPLKDLGLLFRNRIFGFVSLSWFIVGFANLWSLPLRTVYLAEQERGLGLSPFQVVLVLGILPNLLRILLNRYWAGHFDRQNFVQMRVLLNIFIASGILIFFLGQTLLSVAIGSVVMNIGFAGGAYLWNLWVTKVAPPGESQRYMAVHSFLAGVRGVLSPFLGFLAAATVSVRGVGLLSVGIMVIGSLVLIPALRQQRI